MIAKNEITCDNGAIAQTVHDWPIVWYIGFTSRRKSIFHPSWAAAENFGFSSPRVICQCRRGVNFRGKRSVCFQAPRTDARRSPGHPRCIDPALRGLRCLVESSSALSQQWDPCSERASA